jgi:hypothetical protein
VESAQDALARISPDQLVNYVEAWQDDLATWRRWIRNAPRLDGLDTALHYLGLAGRTERMRSRDDSPAARVRSDRSLRNCVQFRRACGE